MFFCVTIFICMYFHFKIMNIDLWHQNKTACECPQRFEMIPKIGV